ncbi:uncharacterized protein THITE_40970 [Thermothielavioides terrestris NRRL 8126]|uniref:Zn(2)-C6 fungal-type domain-containing protein n=1 Tax=Thermothielavioides terrestris (strain ATCC 38088 / NRRL 8126) TaxID=578455 RepID=G2QWN3_THETT|nr:uncharacterized protein THITE_40970 [Thermothielavioides terrestris NRRL 8126]AEO62243.1 hypothetical protein THITE_40970 [Thermothielavioides terrestris NRRL 8126]
MTPVTPHSAVPPPPPPHPPHSQAYGEDRRHVSFDNGSQPGGMYSRQPSYQPPTPLPHPQPYDYPPQYASHGELPYPIQVAAATGKRKAQRASQACDMCRQLKAKCDELKPCKSCKEKNVECKYREAVPKQQDKMAADILDALLTLQSKFETFEQRMDRLEHMVALNRPSAAPTAEPARDEDERPESAESAAPVAGDGDPGSPGEAAPTQAPIDIVQARAITRDMEEEKEVEPGPVVPPGVPSIPPNHTTLAAFLLKWRPIAVLVRDILEAENVKYVGEFPIRQEEKRGLLRVWGRGEGLESSLRFDKADREAIRDAGAMEVVQDDVSDAGGAPSPADCWGGISGSPAPIDGKPVIGLQTPDFSESLVWKYVKSYQDNIQNMHPLIIPFELNAMVKLFLDTVQQSLGRQSRSSGIAKFAVTPSPQSETGSKRKRSPGPEGAGGESPSGSPKSAKPVFQRSINNALVLLVLALGKICLHKDRIPDVVPVSEPPHGSPLARNGYPASPIQASSPSQSSNPHSAGFPSPKEGAERPGPGSRRSSFQGGGGSSLRGGTSLKRNMDVIPGLDYFAYATDILGGQLAGTSLRHIHAYLLAGLYHGQLGRVLESYAYIKEAGFALQIKMRPSLDRFRKLQESMHVNQNAVTQKTDNQLVFAFWTCLQLESDIIAELPLPQSHILAYEDMMPYPNIQVAQTLGFDEHVLQSYLAQLYLRKSLNQIHGMLYNPEKPQPLQRGNIIEHIQESLDMRFVPPRFKFNHSDPPAGDILSARLRAKYWGAQVITYRPFVRQILEFNFQRTYPNEAPMPESDFRTDVSIPVIGPDARSADDIPQEIIDYAVKGIQALIESTRAFHGLKEKRFIVTNVFGTAHAQWGNLLTLSAVFRDPTLHRFVDEQTLKELFARTIAFFKVIAHPTSALHIDLRILEGLERELWGKNSNSTDASDHPTGSSFSSTGSGGAGHPPPAPPPPPPVAPMPPVAGPVGMHSPVNHATGGGGGRLAMSPPLASPLPQAFSEGAMMAPAAPVSASDGGPGSHAAMLPPTQHHPPPPL